MKKILFICHGNICRSPIAASLFQDIINKNNDEQKFFVDSAATSREEIGNSIYPPMIQIAKANNLPLLDHKARQVTSDDINNFDYLIIMDKNNKNNLLRMFPNAKNKTYFLTDFDPKHKGNEIEDPWWTENYTKVYKQINECVLSLYNTII